MMWIIDMSAVSAAAESLDGGWFFLVILALVVIVVALWSRGINPDDRDRPRDE
jgi:hypothetical protein